MKFLVEVVAIAKKFLDDEAAIAKDIYDIGVALGLTAILMIFGGLLVNLLYGLAYSALLNRHLMSKQGLQTLSILKDGWIAIPIIVFIGVIAYGILQALAKRSGGMY